MQSTYDGSYATVAIDGDIAVACRHQHLLHRARHGRVDRVYDNCIVMRFDAEGRCSRVHRVVQQRPDP